MTDVRENSVETQGGQEAGGAPGDDNKAACPAETCDDANAEIAENNVNEANFR